MKSFCIRECMMQTKSDTAKKNIIIQNIEYLLFENYLEEPNACQNYENTFCIYMIACEIFASK